MKVPLPVAAALLFGFLVGHGTEAPPDLFVLLTSIVLVYGAIGMPDLLQALPHDRRRAGRAVGARHRS